MDIGDTREYLMFLQVVDPAIKDVSMAYRLTPGFESSYTDDPLNPDPRATEKVTIVEVGHDYNILQRAIWVLDKRKKKHKTHVLYLRCKVQTGWLVVIEPEELEYYHMELSAVEFDVLRDVLFEFLPELPDTANLRFSY